MAARDDPPLSGVFRVMYFLATAIVTLLVIVSAITAFYDGPESSDPSGIDFGLDDAIVPADEGQQDYNRNVSLILQVTSASLFATAVLGLGSRFNPLRAALVVGGLLAYLVGVGYWAESSDQWLGFVTTLATFAILGFGFMWLEEGLPLEPKQPVRRIEIPPSRSPMTPPPPPPPTPPPPPPLSTPEPPTSASVRSDGPSEEPTPK